MEIAINSRIKFLDRKILRLMGVRIGLKIKVELKMYLNKLFEDKKINKIFSNKNLVKQKL